MTYIRLINRNNNPIEISFTLKQKDKALDYLLLDINVNVNQSENSYNNIVIDFDSIELLIKKVNDFVNADCDELLYSPLEEDFQLRVLRNKITHEAIILQMKKAGLSELSIKQIEEHPETYDLVFMLDTSKYERGIVTNTGVAYWIKITKSDLAEFSSKFEAEYNLFKS